MCNIFTEMTIQMYKNKFLYWMECSITHMYKYMWMIVHFEDIL